MKRRNLHFLSLALALIACERGQVISSGPIDLGAKPVRISMQRTGVSVGPTRQVCLTMAPNERRFHRGPSAANATPPLPNPCCFDYN